MLYLQGRSRLLPSHRCSSVVSSMSSRLVLLHAGYGRKEAAQLLLDAGAATEVQNKDGQTPSDVAEINRELHMVTFLAQQTSSKGSMSGDVFL